MGVSMLAWWDKHKHQRALFDVSWQRYDSPSEIIKGVTKAIMARRLSAIKLRLPTWRQLELWNASVIHPYVHAGESSFPLLRSDGNCALGDQLLSPAHLCRGEPSFHKLQQEMFLEKQDANQQGLDDVIQATDVTRK